MSRLGIRNLAPRKSLGNATREFKSEYGIWRLMIRRCHDPKNYSYQWYGARGIVVCDEWRTDFLAFLVDMGARPDGKEIDRIDNDGPYAPENCRWVSRHDNRMNSPRKVNVTIDGKTMPLTAALAEGVSYCVAYYRLKNGWSDVQATKTPVGARRQP